MPPWPVAALNSGKRAIVAGPGNPPVVVDETADLDRAAKAIILGGAYDNNLLCIAEKEVFVVAAVFDRMLEAMERAGAVRLNTKEIDELTRHAMIQVGEGDQKHDAPAKDFLGQDATVLARGAGRTVSDDVTLLFGETDESNPFVAVEQMMPLRAVCSRPRHRRSRRQSQDLRTRLQAHQHHPFARRA